MRSGLKEIVAYKVSLDADPVAAGVGTFNKKIAEAREYSNRVATILTQAILIKRQVQSARDKKKGQLEMELSHVMGSDSRVFDVPEGQRSSVELRKANANRILVEQGKHFEVELGELDEFFLSASSFYDIVKLTYDNLNETRRDLLYQVSVIRTQITIGEVSSDPAFKNMFNHEGIESTQSGLVPI